MEGTGIKRVHNNHFLSRVPGKYQCFLEDMWKILSFMKFRQNIHDGLAKKSKSDPFLGSQQHSGVKRKLNIDNGVK